MSAHRSAKTDQAGFSLIELVVVVGLVSVVMAVFVVGVRRVADAFALRRTVSVVAFEVRRAQASAVSEGADYTVEFVLGSPGAIAVYRTKQASEACPAGLTAISDTVCRRSIAGGEWPAGIALDATGTTFPACAAPANPANKCVGFRPLGYAETAGSCSSSPCKVRIRSRSGVNADLAITLATGRVSILP